ncbi:MAG: hypothetical protein ACRDHK_09755 [Actinomycetota bacterium]
MPWHLPEQSGWDDHVPCFDPDDEEFEDTLAGFVHEWCHPLARALDVGVEESERLLRSIVIHGVGEDPAVDTTAAALELWWLTGSADFY